MAMKYSVSVVAKVLLKYFNSSHAECDEFFVFPSQDECHEN